jgi:hypothetical protein
VRAEILVLTIAAVIAPSLAHAQDPEPPSERTLLPMRLAERPLTLPALYLRAELDFLLRTRPSFVDMTGGTIEPDPFVSIALGAGFGITDDVEVGASILPISFSPITRFGRPPEITGLPWIYGRFRFLTAPFELGAEARIYLPVPQPDGPEGNIDADFAADLAMLARFHLSEMVRLDAQIFFRLAIPNSMSDTGFGIGIPIDVTVSPLEFLFAGAGIAPLIDRFEAFVLPVSLFVGGTIPVDGKPLVDITGRFGLPLFVLVRESETTVNGDPFELGITVRGYFAL